MRQLIVSLILLLVLCINPAAFRVAPDHTLCSPSCRAGENDFESLGIEGNVALYNLDYAKARNAFERMTRIDPDHPAGYVYLAVYAPPTQSQ
jgi:hypothetical protein